MPRALLLFMVVIGSSACSSGPFRGRYEFTKLMPLSEAPVRSEYSLNLDGRKSTLTIITRVPAKPANEAHWPLVLRPGPGANTLSLDLKLDGGGTSTTWICARLVTHVYPGTAQLVRAPGEACESDAPIVPDSAEPLEVISCREIEQPDAAPADRAEERHRDSRRWTFSAAPGLELLTDRCAFRDGVLRRALR